MRVCRAVVGGVLLPLSFGLNLGSLRPSIAHGTASTTRMLSTPSSTTSSSVAKFLDEMILLEGEVKSGYGRGSKKLGVPTANLPDFDKELTAAGLPNGVYFGWGCVGGDGQVLGCVANIGKSPTFVGEENRVTIIEAHLLDREKAGSSQMRLPGPPSSPPPSTLAATTTDTTTTAAEPVSPAIANDFYGSKLRLCLVAYLRPEQKFENLPALVNQINLDIQIARELFQAGESTDITKISPPAGKYHKVAGAKLAALPFLFNPVLSYSSDKYFELRPAFLM